VSLQNQIVEHIPRLRRYARALMRGDALAADDLVQDCLERALSRLHSWKRGSDLRAWLFTIMHNVYVNQVRRSSNGPQFVEFPEQGPPGQGSTHAESAVNLDSLQRSLEYLSPDQREILMLITVEGLRYKEVAAILDIPEGTVMSRLSRARQQLRTILAQGHSPSIRRVK
jgi:RNA polymerase sigma-70 factor (ECF subfamily)